MSAQKQWKGFQRPEMPWENNLVFSRIADQRGTPGAASRAIYERQVRQFLPRGIPFKRSACMQHMPTREKAQTNCNRQVGRRVQATG